MNKTLGIFAQDYKIQRNPKDEANNGMSVGQCIKCFYFSGEQYSHTLKSIIIFQSLDSAIPSLEIPVKGISWDYSKYSNRVICPKVFNQISKCILSNCLKPEDGLNLSGTTTYCNVMCIIKNTL